jgi:chorismate mutase-like protein
MNTNRSHASFRASRLILFFSVLLVLGCRPAPSTGATSRDQANVDQVLSLIKQRLTLMHDVARWKWHARKPIADPQREQELLEKVVERGRGTGVDADLARRFFSAQMEAARAIQQTDFDRWAAKKDQPDAAGADLDQLRQQIDVLNNYMIDALAGLAPRLGDPAVQQTLRQRARVILDDQLSAEVRETVLAPLAR